MRKVLRICGYPMRELAVYLGRNDTYVNQYLQRTTTSISSRDINGLIRMVTKANFDEAARRICGNTPQKFLRGWELEQILKLAGVKPQEFADELDKSYYFVGTTLFLSKDIPLRYIDSLILYIGLDNYKRFLQQIRQ